MPAHLILLDLITQIICGVECRSLDVISGSPHHSMAHLWVAAGARASSMESSREYIE